MSIISNELYGGGLTFGTGFLGDTTGAGNGFHFDLPLATVAAFNQQALDFSSAASASRLGFFSNIAHQTQSQDAESRNAAHAAIASQQSFMDRIRTGFMSFFSAPSPIASVVSPASVSAPAAIAAALPTPTVSAPVSNSYVAPLQFPGLPAVNPIQASQVNPGEYQSALANSVLNPSLANYGAVVAAAGPGGGSGYYGPNNPYNSANFMSAGDGSA